MKSILKFITIATLLLIFQVGAKALNINDHRIAVLVNDQLITSYEVIQRMKMNTIFTGVNITIENNNQLANAVVDELIKERLKTEKLIEFDISISEDEYVQREKTFFDNMAFSKNEIMEIFKNNDVNYDDFKNYLINELSWQKLISAMYYRLTSVSEVEIAEIMKKDPNISKIKAEDIVIQRQLDLQSSKMIRDMFNEATIEYK
tara:strand:- start:951 stop:1562 length:612 start_codon:yes stop_codon:yes gene_type:complete